MSCNRLASCKQLKFVEFGQALDNIERIPYENLVSVKSFLKRKVSSLVVLKLYDCDEQVLQILSNSVETQSLEELQIVKFN